MTYIKPTLPKGTRDFSPEVMVKRNYIFDILKDVFNRYGYMPLETPSLENLSTLLGKYGDEGDRLIFKILNSGNYLSKTRGDDIKDINKFTSKISDKGLRYDLTVPFARYVVMNRNEINFPFKRYQMQPVWRADRPQKGRYREFYQCDIDVIGTKSLLNEAELIMIINDVFKRLNLDICIKINNRKILSGIATHIGYPEKLTEITIAIDKMEKIGLDNVIAELKENGIDDNAIELLLPIFDLSGSNKQKIEQLSLILADNQEGLLGIAEVKELFEYISYIDDVNFDCELDLTLARGLNYYTGTIIEVKAKDVNIGSICGGGRYDNLTSIFGMPDVSGVGISFGAERIFDVMSELDLFPKSNLDTTKVLFLNFGDNEVKYSLPLINNLRKSNINTELYPDNNKVRKQMDYANKRNIPYVVIIGEDEVKNNKASVKNMTTGEQNIVDKDDIINYIK